MRTSILAVAGLAAVLSGCASSAPSNDVSPSAIRDDLTPELDTTYQRPGDSRNMIATTWNYDWRNAKSDFYRGAHWNRPHRLSPAPTAH